MKRVIVIGAGAAGCFASYSARLNGAHVVLLEKNHIIGKKIRITGKGRCNVTNKSDIEDIIKNIYKNGNFMYSSIYTYTNENVIDDFEKYGVELKVERGNRVFPKSDKAIDVILGIEKMLSDVGVDINLNTRVKKLIVKGLEYKSDNKEIEVIGVELENGKKLFADAVIVATGGKSYPLTGSNGDGYKLLENVGHRITKLKSALVGLETQEEIDSKLVGLILKNISIRVICENKTIYKDFGELEYRNYGIDGAIIKSASCHIDDEKNKEYKVLVDLKPALDREKLDNRIQRDFKKFMNKDFEEVLKGLMPSSMMDSIIARVGIDRNKKVHQITREERLRLVYTLKNLEYNIISKRPLKEAIVTDGGVEVKEVNSSTMESKLVKKLYIAGEILDISAYTGGYNLQVAFSTGYLAGMNAADL